MISISYPLMAPTVPMGGTDSESLCGARKDPVWHCQSIESGWQGLNARRGAEYGSKDRFICGTPSKEYY